MLNTIMECVPNFSEGRDLAKVEKIVDAFRGKEGVKLLDYSSDKDHNRTVVTVIGEIEPLGDAVIEAIGIAAQLIDLTHHQGEHPRMGAADVVPFIPIKNCTVQEADALAKRVGKEVAERFHIPSFLYEKSATAPHRENLAAIRKGQFEGMFEKMKQPEWKPDFGPDTPHPTAGVFAVGARMPLVAFNVNLDTANLILYGKANPVDALDVFGGYVRGVHAKDGLYPTNGRELGTEVKVGAGKVNFPALLRGLKAHGFDGSLTIEREIEGEEQIRDILEAQAYLNALIAEL